MSIPSSSNIKFGTFEELNAYLKVTLSTHKKPKNAIKQAILADPTGKTVLDLYEKTLIFLSIDSKAKDIKKLSENLDKKISKEDVSFNPEQIARFKSLKASFKQSPVSSDDVLSQYLCKLKDLPSIADQVHKNRGELAKKIVKKIASTIQKNSSEKSSKKDFKSSIPGKVHTYEFNRTGRNIDGITLNASDIKTPKQAYICSNLVHSPEFTQDYFTAALEQNGSLFISLHEFKDAKKENPKFWDNDVLSKFPNKNGWQIKNLGEVVLAKSDKLKKVKIIESKLVAKKGDIKRNITHIHFTGWKNGDNVPDEKLLQTLIYRINELNINPSHPIAINCKGGVGRTGLTAAVHSLQCEINHQLEEGRDLDDVEINIPAAVYGLRSQRHGMLKNDNKIAQIYSVISSYYKSLKA